MAALDSFNQILRMSEKSGMDVEDFCLNMLEAAECDNEECPRYSTDLLNVADLLLRYPISYDNFDVEYEDNLTEINNISASAKVSKLVVCKVLSALRNTSIGFAAALMLLDLEGA